MDCLFFAIWFLIRPIECSLKDRFIFLKIDPEVMLPHNIVKCLVFKRLVNNSFDSRRKAVSFDLLIGVGGECYDVCKLLVIQFIYRHGCFVLFLVLNLFKSWQQVFGKDRHHFRELRRWHWLHIFLRLNVVRNGFRNWLRLWRLSDSCVLVLSDKFHDLCRRFNTVHHWHLDVHNYELVSPVRAPTLSVKALLEHFISYFSVDGFVNSQLEVFKNHASHSHDVEGCIINYKNSWLTVARLANDFWGNVGALYPVGWLIFFLLFIFLFNFFIIPWFLLFLLTFPLNYATFWAWLRAIIIFFLVKLFCDLTSDHPKHFLFWWAYRFNARRNPPVWFRAHWWRLLNFFLLCRLLFLFTKAWVRIRRVWKVESPVSDPSLCIDIDIPDLWVVWLNTLLLRLVYQFDFTTLLTRHFMHDYKPITLVRLLVFFHFL